MNYRSIRYRLNKLPLVKNEYYSTYRRINLTNLLHYLDDNDLIINVYSDVDGTVFFYDICSIPYQGLYKTRFKAYESAIIDALTIRESTITEVPRFTESSVAI